MVSPVLFNIYLIKKKLFLQTDNSIRNFGRSRIQFGTIEKL